MRIRTMQGVDIKRGKAIRHIMLWSLASAVASALMVIGVQTMWAAAGDSPKMEVLLSQKLSDLEGREMVLIELEYPPGVATKPHRHPSHTIVYVISGQIESSVDDGVPIVYGPGESFYESPMQLHATFRNPSATKPFKAIAVMVRDTSKPITIMEDAR
jgi:quercetin dioxygenase-like cupin family protein